MSYEQTTADALRELATVRVDFAALQRALVGDTASSAIIVAAALRKDAERYRKLRDRQEADVRIVYVGKRSGAALDAAVDALPAVGAA